MAWPKYPSQTELLTAKALASEATAPLAALTEELTGLREQLDTARADLGAIAHIAENPARQGNALAGIAGIARAARAALGVEGPAE